MEEVSELKLVSECQYCNEFIPVYMTQQGKIMHSVCISKTGEPEFGQFECLRFKIWINPLDILEIEKYNDSCPPIPYTIEWKTS